MDVLRKILELEASKGHTNTAVIGGIDRFLQERRSDLAMLAKNSPELITPSYAAMDAATRKEMGGRLARSAPQR